MMIKFSVYLHFPIGRRSGYKILLAYFRVMRNSRVSRVSTAEAELTGFYFFQNKKSILLIKPKKGQGYHPCSLERVCVLFTLIGLW